MFFREVTEFSYLETVCLISAPALTHAGSPINPMAASGLVGLTDLALKVPTAQPVKGKPAEE